MILSAPARAHTGHRGLRGVGQLVTPPPRGRREHLPASGRDHVGHDGVPDVSGPEGLLHETQRRLGCCLPGSESPVRSLRPRGGLGGVVESRPARPGRCPRNSGWDRSSRERQGASTLLEAKTRLGHLSHCGLCRWLLLWVLVAVPTPCKSRSHRAGCLDGCRALGRTGLRPPARSHPKACSSEAPKSLGCDPLSSREPPALTAPHTLTSTHSAHRAASCAPAQNTWDTPTARKQTVTSGPFCPQVTLICTSPPPPPTAGTGVSAETCYRQSPGGGQASPRGPACAGQGEDGGVSSLSVGVATSLRQRTPAVILRLPAFGTGRIPGFLDSLCP